ncbi:MAG: hypothetical protein KDC46_02000 [Thermoleophilia bacterium]|nr:hypothetical protein [Thermoleophilia bacterium]
MRIRRRVRSEAEQVDDEVLRDAEESLVAALQESDTAVEAMQDAEADARDGRTSRRWQVGIAGVVLAALGFVVARRRS